MKAKLFADDWPSGRSVLLAQELATTAGLSARDALHAAESLFGMNHGAESPLEIELRPDADTTRLQQLCRDLGIVCEL